MDELLMRVERPSRYLGNEVNAVRKDLETVELTMGLSYPDLYEIGMSNTGLHILYYMLNEAPWVAAERVYLPALDLERLLQAEGKLLTTLENRIPLRDLDVLGIQIPHELSYTNIIKTIRMGGLTLWTRDRGRDEAVVLGGGPGVFGAEPVAPFYDAMLLGDAEDALWQVLECVKRWRASGADRPALHRELAAITGVYVPELYQVSYHPDGRVAAVEPRPGSGAPALVHKAVVEDLEQAYYPDKAIVPYAETVHNRLGVEVMRGCTVGCRFCQAGMIYRPVRERSPRRILDLAKCGLGATGYEDISLLSLDTGDYTLIDPLTKELLRETADKRVALSLPSLRAGSLTDDVIRDIRRVRRTSFTIAPEAGTQRLRDVINKNISDEEIFETVERVARAGWQGIKLYFMVGFPTETDEDLHGLVELVERCRDLGRRHTRRFEVTASVGTLVPKPQTPFQWDPQIPEAESLRRIRLLERAFKERRISFKFHAPLHSWMEGVFSRGDRRLSVLLADAESRGAGFESWSDRLDPELWRTVFREHGLDPEWYLRQRGYDEVLPWDHLSARVTKKFLLGDRKKVDRMQEPVTFDCRDDLCAGCSACFTDDIRNRLAKYDPDPFRDGRRLPLALVSRVAIGHGVAQQVEKQARDQAAKAGTAAVVAKLRRSRRPKNPSERRWAVTPGSPGLEGPAPAFLREAEEVLEDDGLTPGSEVPAGEAPASEPVAAAPEEAEAPATPDPAARPPLHAYLLVYQRRGRLRWLSGKELVRTFYRLLGRSGLPLRYTAGFHPKPKVAFGPPLPVGAESLQEELGIFLERPLPPEQVFEALAPLLPAEHGLVPLRVEAAEAKGLAQWSAARWEVDLGSLPDGAAAGARALERWQAEGPIPHTVHRPGKPPRPLELREVVEDVALSEGGLRFTILLDGPAAKPYEVVACLTGLPTELTRQGRYLLREPVRRQPALVAS